MFKRSWVWITIAFLMVWLVQNSTLLFAELMHDDESTEFSSFVYKGPFSFSDVLFYADITRYSAENPSLLRGDGMIKENEGLMFAAGNIINVYAGGILNLVGDIDLVPIVGSILPTLLCVFFLFKISKIFLQDAFSNVLFLALCILVLLHNFDDVFGIWKFISGYILELPEADDIIPVGYNQRFLYGQFSTFIFLFWIYSILSWWENPSIQNQFLIALSLVLCHYTYFYYWSYAVPLTFGVFVFKMPKWKSYIGLVVFYLLGTIHYWDNYFAFNSTEFSGEYLKRIKGPEVYPFIAVLCVGFLSGWSIILRYKKTGILLFLFPVLLVLCLKKVVAVFTIGSFYHILCIVFLGAFTLGLLIYSYLKMELSKMELLNIFNFYLMIFLNSLAYIIGYNVQPYHWIYTSYFLVLAICMFFMLKPYYSNMLVRKSVLILSSLIVVLGLFNSFRFADRNGPFWKLTSDDVEVIDFIKQLPEKPVIGGDNIMPLITFSAHADMFMYTGLTCHSRSSYHELYYRFISNYKLLGYSNEDILNVYEKYKGHKEYWKVYNGYDVQAREELGKQWPDNLTLAAEALHHYFILFESMKPELKKELANFDSKEYDFQLDYQIIHKPTPLLPRTGDVVLENATFIILKVD